MQNYVRKYINSIIWSTIFLFIVILPPTLGETSAPVTCSMHCKCIGITLNCTQKGMSLPPTGLSTEFRYFYFDNIGLQQIENGDFDHFTSMKTLILSDNEIASISENAFTKNTHLIQLDLSNNTLENLPDNLFQNNRQLQSLYLSRNRILSINATTFETLVDLRILRMNDNQLKFIDSNAFMNLHKLQELYLEDNNLITPHKEWLKSFDHIDGTYEVYLDNNQWSCDCNMKPFMHWFKSQNWYSTPSGESRVSIPQCHEPEVYKRRSIKHMTEADFTCEEMIVADIERSVFIKDDQEYTMWCNASGIPVPVVSISRKGSSLPLSVGAGATKLTLKPTSSNSGEYICKAEGATSHGQSFTQSTYIKVVVQTNNSTVLIVIAVLFSLVVCGVAVWFYKAKYSRNKYTSLPSSNMQYSAHEEVVNGQDSSPLANGEMQIETASDDEINYTKDSEKEVLV